MGQLEISEADRDQATVGREPAANGAQHVEGHARIRVPEPDLDILRAASR
jgi:hypothetical protein